MTEYHGNDWHNAKWKNTDKTIAEIAKTPSIIYSKAVVEMFGGYNGQPRAKVNGVAHITGGGIPGKLGRALKASKLGAEINDPFLPPEIMIHMQKMGNVSDRTAYETWNMGNGMIIITPEPQKVMQVASEHKIQSKIIGKVIKDPLIKIKSKGANALAEKELVFDLK